jgi:hypothetical protein
MLKPILVGTSLALAAALSLPAAAQQRTPGMPSDTPSQAPAQKNMGASMLNLTQEEQHTVLQNVDKAASPSTMGLGALTEGGAVPSGVKPQKFSATVTSKIPRLATYTYFSADNKVAIVEPNGGKIAAVLDQSAPAAK